jgi:hypothetical protein
VGSEVDGTLKGKLASFCYGSWSQWVIRDFDHLIIFNNKNVDPIAASHAFVNPLTALCIREWVRETVKSFGQKDALVLFLGADCNLGSLFLKVCSGTDSPLNLDIVPVVRRDESLKALTGLKQNNLRLSLDTDNAFPEKDFCKIIE